MMKPGMVLNEYPFEPVDISGRLGIDFQEDSLKEGYIQLLSGRSSV